MNILSFSGFIPEQICDTVRFLRYDGSVGISHYCGYAADFISQVLDDPQVDGAVFPRTCDSSRAMAGYLDGCGKFLFQMHIPARRDAAAAELLRSTILEYKQAVEEYYGLTITDAEVAERAALVNARNRELAALYEGLADISYGAYLDMVHGLLQTPLREQAVDRNLPGSGPGGRRVFLIGSLLGSTDIARAIEDAGMKVVGDRLTESKRLFSAPAAEPDKDLYGAIAKSILGNRPSPTQDSFRDIVTEDMEEIRRKQVQGVLFVTQKYCEPYDYLFAVYKKALDGAEIPSLQLKLTDSTDVRKAEAAIGAFADIL